jgi:hypothetical protein
MKKTVQDQVDNCSHVRSNTGLQYPQQKTGADNDLTASGCLLNERPGPGLFCAHHVQFATMRRKCVVP